jgi:ubiquinone/menaquinone biosynthesis C-methylase UbiE
MMFVKELSMTVKRTRRPGRWYLPEVLYDVVLERPLTGIRRKVSELVTEAGLFPLVDICCGPGNQLRRLAAASLEAGRPSVGLDINFKAARYAAARAPEIPFICGDGTALPFRAGSFKGVLLSFALHEQEPEVRRRILRAARETLVPGGRLVLVDFENPWDSTSRLAYAYTSVIEWIAGRDHLRRNRDFYRRGGLRALLAENGFLEIFRHDIAAGTCAVVIAVPGP